MPSIFDLEKQNSVTISYETGDGNLLDFHCELPPFRLLTDAQAEAEREQKRNKSDRLGFARRLFVPCVKSWSLHEECNDENKRRFLEENALLNKIALYVTTRLVQEATPRFDEQQGN
jgi:hypothetical protein